MKQNIWFTPEGLEDLLPAQAQKLEFYRRQLLDGFQFSGYDLVLPPIAEFTDSLLTGTGRHLAVETCRFTDQESGKMMGVRADMTPQVARIVTNRLKTQDEIVRLCYVGEVLKTRNNKAKGSRSPIQIGVELFGHSGIEADMEVISIMIEAVKGIGIESMTISLGQVAIVNELMKLAGLSESQQAELIEILQRKAVPEYEAFIAQLTLSGALKAAFEKLLSFSGSAQKVIAAASAELVDLSSTLKREIENLKLVADFIGHYPQVKIHCDLSDMRGYQYHTGMIFSCYASGRKTHLLAKGGRYDGVGSDFGVSQPATGFSMDLRGALDLLAEAPEQTQELVYAPMMADAQLLQQMASLKSQQTRVQFFYDATQVPSGSKMLEQTAGEWSIVTKKS